MIFKILNRWTGKVQCEVEIGAEFESRPYSAQLSAAVKVAIKNKADLREANLHGADLRGANLTPIRDDFWAVLSSAPAEVPALREAIVAGIRGCSWRLRERWSLMLSRSEWENAVAVLVETRNIDVHSIDTRVNRRRNWRRNKRTGNFDDDWNWEVAIHLEHGRVILENGNSPEACLEQLNAEIAKRFPVHKTKPLLWEQLAANDG